MGHTSPQNIRQNKNEGKRDEQVMSMKEEKKKVSETKDLGKWWSALANLFKTFKEKGWTEKQLFGGFMSWLDGLEFEDGELVIDFIEEELKSYSK